MGGNEDSTLAPTKQEVQAETTRVGTHIILTFQKEERKTEGVWQERQEEGRVVAGASG